MEPVTAKIKVKVKKATPAIIASAADIIRSGGLVVYPTETVYGLGADARLNNAVSSVFQIKARPIENPITVAVSSLKMAEEFTVLNKLPEMVLREMLPGPLTVILLAKKSKVSELLMGGTGKIGIRIPDHPLAVKLIETVGGPITATSANISGEPAPTTVNGALKQLGKKVDLILDAGRCKLGKPSTVVDLSSGKLKILRKGPISSSKLNKILRKQKP